MIRTLISKKESIDLMPGSYLVEKFQGYHNHFIGIDENNNIAILIYNLNPKNLLLAPFKGKNLEIYFDRETDISTDSGLSVGKYTILKLLDGNDNIQWYFTEICELLLTKLGDSPGIIAVEKEVSFLKDIFVNLTKSPVKEELGLWGELLLIEIQQDINMAVKAWHVSNTDRIDFNDGNIKVEVKTTSSIERKHIFKLNQLRNYFKEEIWVASVMTSEIDNGITVKKLVDRILNQLNTESKVIFNQKLTSCLGEELFNITFKSFDYNFAIDNLRLFEAIEIPSIDLQFIPENVSKVQFTSDLKDASSMDNVAINNIFTC